MGKGKRKRRNRVAWWKKTPEMERFFGHVGRAIDRIPPLEAGLLLGCAYYGYNQTGDWIGALTGALGYKLATNPGGASGIIPNVSRMAGLAMLGGLVIHGSWPFTSVEPPEAPDKGPFSPGRCPEGKTLMIRAGGYLCVPDAQIGNYEYRGWEKYEDYLKRTNQPLEYYHTPFAE